MARQNRRDIFDPHRVSIVHCVQRAVRRAMLCGIDRYSGQSFEHRRQWVQDRLRFLAAHYGIDVLGYAIMGNHLHVILRNRPDVVKTWSDREVALRIWKLCTSGLQLWFRRITGKRVSNKKLLAAQRNNKSSE